MQPVSAAIENAARMAQSRRAGRTMTGMENSFERQT
jgi:hypothetical protein